MKIYGGKTLSMGRIIVDHVGGKPSDVVRCGDCRSPLFSFTEVISQHFTGKSGEAWLVDQCVNYYMGYPEQKMLRTGQHVVRDVYCRCCDQLLGWTYDAAEEKNERYKLCKFVLERAFLYVDTRQAEPLFELERS